MFIQLQQQLSWLPILIIMTPLCLSSRNPSCFSLSLQLLLFLGLDFSIDLSALTGLVTVHLGLNGC